MASENRFNQNLKILLPIVKTNSDETLFIAINYFKINEFIKTFRILAVFRICLCFYSLTWPRRPSRTFQGKLCMVFEVFNNLNIGK
jgi:hypothetical protein